VSESQDTGFLTTDDTDLTDGESSGLSVLCVVSVFCLFMVSQFQVRLRLLRKAAGSKTGGPNPRKNRRAGRAGRLRSQEFVDHLPSGLDTLVGDRGVRLSGGERQRLTMARALLGHPSILILDEATSSLDTENERLIQEAIHRLHGELTVVVIAHRLSTVRKADSIIVLNQGEIVEHGTWQALVSRPGSLFAGMVQAGAQ
jgi:ABC-type transport system involved in Fe-S cluster assembly fused permease/ATPase subunit